MDKTTTWLIRAASLIVILFGIGYVSKPVGNKINDLSSTFKDFRSKPNLKGLACGSTKEDLNKSDDDFFNEKVSDGIYLLFDKKNGERYFYDAKTNYVVNFFDLYSLSLKGYDLPWVIRGFITYKKNSIIYVDLVSFLENGEEASRERAGKFNLKTLDWYEYYNNSYSLEGPCRYIKVPKNITLVEAEEFL
tara:strand:- start:8 stop:580 length:573 start_codon:yes stop_codon:yes gene_type:complete